MLSRNDQRIKRTRPGFDEGKLIWSKIENIVGKQYRVRLELTDRKHANSNRFYYDWVEIDPLDDPSDDGVLEQTDSEDNLLIGKIDSNEYEGVSE